MTVPTIGFGTHGVPNGAVRSAALAGYRLFDTAVAYGNEETVGSELQSSGLRRDDYRIMTKLPGRDHGFRETVQSLRSSLKRLGTDAVDLYLIHWPNPHAGRYLESWRAMIELQGLGLTRSIGVSNFTEEHLNTLIDETGVVPSVNQVELHPNWRQDELRQYHATHGIATMA